MQSFHVLVVRDDGKKPGVDPTMVALLASLLVLVVLSLLMIGGLFWLRSLRKAKRGLGLPLYEKRQAGHRRLTITASPYGNGRDSVFVIQEKQNLVSNSSSPPPSPVPEIRITFPDEVDASGKRQSGRVLVVRVGEHNVGLEPLNDDQLPPYQRDSSDRFDSLDLDRIGGLKEKDDKYYS